MLKVKVADLDEDPRRESHPSEAGPNGGHDHAKHGLQLGEGETFYVLHGHLPSRVSKVETKISGTGRRAIRPSWTKTERNRPVWLDRQYQMPVILPSG